ncbi:ABC transporter permease [Patescibacteria group bacterium]|nr:ABC transporter permease [Patescibacteria group bacterium]
MKKGTLGKLFKTREFTIIVVLIILTTVFGTLSENFLSTSNLKNIFIQISSIGIASVGMTIIIITAGIDVSAGSILGVIAVVAGKSALAGIPVPLIIILAILAGGLLGSINGSLVSFTGIPPIIVTLGTMSFLRAMVYQLLGGRWISSFPETFRRIGTGDFIHIPTPVWFMILFAIIFTYYLKYRPTGRYIYAIGSNPEAARLSGIPVKKMLLLVYVLAGMMYGVAGVIVAGRTGIVQTNTGAGFELSVIAATVLGGTNIMGGEGSAIGSMLGALLVAVITNGMVLVNLPALTEGLIIGTIIIISVLTDILKLKRRSV